MANTSKLILNFSGPQKLGHKLNLKKYLKEVHGELEDAQASKVDDYFSMMVSVKVAPDKKKVLSKRLFNVDYLNITIYDAGEGKTIERPSKLNKKKSKKDSKKKSKDKKNRNSQNQDSSDSESDDDDSVKRAPQKRARIVHKVVEDNDFAMDNIKTTPKSDEERNILSQALKKCYSLELEDREMSMVIDYMEKQDVEADTIIFKEGEEAEYFYVIEKGLVEILLGDRHITQIGTGAIFGESVLMFDEYCVATVQAHTDAVLWKCSSKTVRHVVSSKAIEDEKKNTNILSKIPLFSGMPKATMNKFLAVLKHKNFPSGQNIVKKGDIGDVFYLIEEGEVKIHDIGSGTEHVELTCGPGKYFGERALLTNEPRAASCTAITDVVAYAVDRMDFEAAIGSLKSVLQEQMKRSNLQSINIIAKANNITEAEMTKLVAKTTERHYKKGEKIAVAGKPFEQQIVIIRQGKASVSTRGGDLHILKGGDEYGDNSIHDEGYVIEDCNDTVIIDADTEAYVLTKKDIEEVLGDLNQLGERSSYLGLKRNDNIKFKDLTKHQILGQGAFGSVFLVTINNKKKGEKEEYYAVKRMDKKEVLESGMTAGIIREKDILASLDHPFILTYVSSFQDDRYLFLLISLVRGGELFKVIHDLNRGDGMKGLPNKDAVFYGACVIDALGHMHERSICYRDLKPENVLIDDEGYCIVVDLGFAKVVMDKTYTMCGTPEYIAPEIISGKGHRTAVDWWAFGVLLFEMLTGGTPFNDVETAGDQVRIFKKIMKAKYKVPIPEENPNIRPMTPTAEDLVAKLLVKSRSKRLGNLARSYLDVAEHPYFDGITADDLLNKKIRAPWIPKIEELVDEYAINDDDDFDFDFEKLSKANQAQFAGF